MTFLLTASTPFMNLRQLQVFFKSKKSGKCVNPHNVAASIRKREEGFCHRLERLYIVIREYPRKWIQYDHSPSKSLHWHLLNRKHLEGDRGCDEI